MVDVTAKEPTARRAVAWCRVRTGADPAAPGPDDAVIEAARLAGIGAAKQTASLIPLCHPLPIGEVAVECRADGDVVDIVATVATWARTGVEMEALTACALAGLTVLASVDATEHGALEALTLLDKRGGRSGTWTRPGWAEGAAAWVQLRAGTGGSGSA
jgi:cyclic pyranopterin phosphate synthase